MLLGTYRQADEAPALGFALNMLTLCKSVLVFDDLNQYDPLKPVSPFRYLPAFAKLLVYLYFQDQLI